MPLPKDKTTVVSEGGGSFEPLSEGMHSFQVADVYLIEDVQTNWGPKDQLYWYVVCLDGEERGEIVTYRTTMSFNAGFEGGSPSKLYDLACAVEDDILDDTEPFDISSLLSGTFDGKVEQKEAESGNTYTNIVKTKSINRDAESLTDKELEEAKLEAAEIHEKIKKKVPGMPANVEDDTNYFEANQETTG